MKKSLIHGVSYVLMAAVVPPPLALAQSATPAPSASSQAVQQQAFTQAELDQMLAPIALYPDALLSQMLMASTYPLEVVQADRWIKQHKGLNGTALQNALASQPWDASVESLCAFPQVLDRMSRDLAWTENVGDAFIDQQQQVMDTIQNLRAKAQAAGTLRSDTHEKVVVEDGYISIAPADPQIVYVPTYDPRVVYGAWWWPAYPPYYPVYWGPSVGPALGNGFFWGVGIAAGLALWGAFDWHRHAVHVDVNRYNGFNRRHITDNRWHFDPGHRHGVPFHGPYDRGRVGVQEQRAEHARQQFRARGESVVHAPNTPHAGGPRSAPDAHVAGPRAAAPPHVAAPNAAPPAHAAGPRPAAPPHVAGPHSATAPQVAGPHSPPAAHVAGPRPASPPHLAGPRSAPEHHAMAGQIAHPAPALHDGGGAHGHR